VCEGERECVLPYEHIGGSSDSCSSHFDAPTIFGLGLRVGLHHRALAVEAPDGLLWFWIGTHAEYDKLVG
jgi:hypothetical protein